MADDTNSNISIKSLAPAHSGVYKIIAQNIAGTVEAEFNITVLGKSSN